MDIDRIIVENLDRVRDQVVQIFDAYELQIIENEKTIRELAARLVELDEEKRKIDENLATITAVELRRRTKKEECLKIGYTAAAEEKRLRQLVADVVEQETKCTTGAASAIAAATATITAAPDQKTLDQLAECNAVVAPRIVALPALEGVYESFRLAEQRDREKQARMDAGLATEQDMANKTTFHRQLANKINRYAHEDRCKNYTIQQLQNLLKEISEDKDNPLPPMMQAVNYLNPAIEGKTLVDYNGSIVYSPSIEDPVARIRPLCEFFLKMGISARNTYTARMAKQSPVAGAT